MEEKRLTRRFSDVFDEIVPVVEKVVKGFLTQNAALVQANHAKFREILKARIAFAEEIQQKKGKDEAELKFLKLVIAFQSVASGLENLIEKIEIKGDSNILFSDKAIKEITQLFAAIRTQYMNTRDYVITENPHLKERIRKDMEEVMKLIGDFSVTHQDRLIKGLCTPKASYLYIDISDSIKRIAKGLVAFSEQI